MKLSKVSSEPNGDRFTLVFVRELRHPPEKVWAALTDPAQVGRWSPYETDRPLDEPGPAILTMIDGDVREPLDATVLRADAPHLLEYTWGTDLLVWELEGVAEGTRLTLRHTLQDKEWLPKVAAGWHICLDVAQRMLAGEQVEAIRGKAAMEHGWQELNDGYAELL